MWARCVQAYAQHGDGGVSMLTQTAAHTPPALSVGVVAALGNGDGGRHVAGYSWLVGWLVS